MNRREFLMMAGLASLSAAFPSQTLFAKAQPHVVIIGGGVGGATTAKYLRMMDQGIKVTIIEKNRIYLRPYGSSEVINAHVTMKDLEVSYDALKNKYGVNFVFDEATGVNVGKQTIQLKNGSDVAYDRLVVAPGIKLLYDQVEGYSEAIANQQIPSAWIPGQQTQMLHDQLKAMPKGGTFLIVAPPNPYRCPPGPYERGALVAEWCQQHNPTAKVMIVDPKDKFVTDQSMMLGWNRRYGFNIPDAFIDGMPSDVKTHSSPGILEWIPAKDGGKIISLDAKQGTVKTEGGTIKADVINIIPPMQAGAIASTMGLTNDKQFCPIYRKTFESRIHNNIHVIGDSSIADMMPKSGFSANTQGKVTAKAIIDLLTGREPCTPTWENTCYALAAKDYGFFVADVFKIENDRITRQKGPRYLPLDASIAQLRLAAVYQQNWLRSFTEDCFA